jgi:hypothetical protein
MICILGWQKIHLDLAGPFLGNMWLIVVDAHSKFVALEMTQLLVKSLTAFVKCRWGLPQTLVTDNGPQFGSKEFDMFCSKEIFLNL